MFDTFVYKWKNANNNFIFHRLFTKQHYCHLRHQHHFRATAKNVCDSVGDDIMFSVCLSVCLSAAFVRPFVNLSGQILLPRYLVHALNNIDKTGRESSTDDMIRSWRSKVKGQGYSRPSMWRRHPRRRWGVKVYLLFLLFISAFNIT